MIENLELEKAKEVVEKAKKEKLENASIRLKEFLEKEGIVLRVQNNLNGNILESYIIVEAM